MSPPILKMTIKSISKIYVKLMGKMDIIPVNDKELGDW